MKEITVKKYIADDGMEFNNRIQCETYERNCRVTFSEEFECIPHVDDCASALGFTYRYSQDDGLRVVRIRNGKDLATINDYLRFCGFDAPDLLSENDIGTVQIFWNWDGSWIGSSEVFRIGTPMEWKKYLCEEVDVWFEKIMKRGEI